MGKLEQLSEQLAEAQQAARAWKRRALGAEARVTALEGELAQKSDRPVSTIRTRCANVERAAGAPVQCSRTSGHEGPHHDAWGALFWPNV